MIEIPKKKFFSISESPHINSGNATAETLRQDWP